MKGDIRSNQVFPESIEDRDKIMLGEEYVFEPDVV